ASACPYQRPVQGPSPSMGVPRRQAPEAASLGARARSRHANGPSEARGARPKVYPTRTTRTEGKQRMPRLRRHFPALAHLCPLDRGQQSLRVPDELGVVSCQGAVRKDGRVLEAGANTMAPPGGSLRDGPARDQVAVVHLLELDAGLDEHRL